MAFSSKFIPHKNHASIASSQPLFQAMMFDFRFAHKEIEHPTLDGDWNIAQTIHHLADSHIHAYTRMKLILTEDRPTLKTWEQETWAELDDAKQSDVTASLSILRGLHSRWSTLLSQLNPDDFARVGIHPDMGELSIDHFVETYARHGHGHIRQIQIALVM